MLRTLCIILLIVLGLVGIAGGIWGLSLRAESDVPTELLGAAQTVLDYADKAFTGANDKIAEWTNNEHSLTSILNDLAGGKVDVASETSLQLFMMVHALEVLLGGVVCVETGLLLIRRR